MGVITRAYLGLHLSGFLWVHSPDVLVMPNGVLAILILNTHILLQGLQDAVGLRGEEERERGKEKKRGRGRGVLHAHTLQAGKVRLRGSVKK